MKKTKKIELWILRIYPHIHIREFFDETKEKRVRWVGKCFPRQKAANLVVQSSTILIVYDEEGDEDDVRNYESPQLYDSVHVAHKL